MPEAGTTGVAFALAWGLIAQPAGHGWPPAAMCLLLTCMWLQTSFLCELLSLLHHPSL